MAKVLVVGAGALGSLLGALLQEARHDVLLLARGQHVREITLEGLRVTGGAYGPPRRVPVRAAPEAPQGYRPDLVILGVKTQDITSALTQHAHALGTAPVVALQNGLAQDALVAQAVGPQRTVAAVTVLDAEFREPGHVDCARRGTLILGGPEPAASRARDILRTAVSVKSTSHVVGARWTKLIVNLGNVVPAITDLSFQDAARHPLLGRVHVRLIREGVRVAQAEGAKLERLPWTSPVLLRAAASAPEGLAKAIYAARVRMILGRAPAFGSTWQSVQRGGSLETQWLNGEVVRRGAAAGVPTPANRAAVELAQSGKTLTPDEAGRVLLEAG